MTASKIWALIVGLVVGGAGLIGTVLYYRENPDGTQISRLVQPAAKPPASTTPASKPSPPAPASKPVQIPESTPAPSETGKGAPKAPEIAKEEPKTPPKPEPPVGNGEPPHFDVVRVEPTGEAVLAGKGDPNSKVALMASGKVVAEAKADPNGNFVILPPPLKPGDHDLSLRETPEGKPPVESKQNVAVSVPQKPGDQVVVALAEPGKPTKVLSGTPETKPSEPASKVPSAEPPKKAEQPPAKPDEPQVAVAKPETKVEPPVDLGLAVRSVELEHGDGLFASGVAAPGTKVEIYLNGSHLAQVVAGSDRQWTVTVKKGLAGGHYAVRADAIGSGSTVVARVEVPFDVPIEMTEATKPGETTPAEKPQEQAAAPTPAAPEPSKPEGPGEDKRDDAPAAKADQPAPESRVVASEPEPSEAAKEPSPVPIPRPDVAARAKAAVAEAPAVAPPTLAAAPPASAETRTAMPPAQTPVAPPTPAVAPPTLASEKPTVAPPAKPAEVAAVTPDPAPTSAPSTAADAQPATNTPAVASPAPAETPSSSNAVINQVETALVVRGDNLWNISRTRLGNPMRYTQIYTSNASQIRNPNLIYPGQVFVMPQP